MFTSGKMRIQKKYQGVVIPMITPITNEGKIDNKHLSGLIEYYLKAETTPFILGTTGESASLSDEMSEELVTSVAGLVSGRTEIYAGISDTCFENSVKTAHKYFDLGANVFVAHIPEYYPITPDQILRYFEQLADTLPAPLMLYNIPATTKLSIPIEIIEKLSKHPNIIGLKDSERSLDRMKILADKFTSRMDFSIMSGWTIKSTYALSLGFDGIVPSTGNLIPYMFTELYKAIIKGNRETAEEIQGIINPIANFHQKDIVISHAIAMLKVMMNELGLCDRTVLPPLTRLSAEKEEQIEKMMKNFNFGDFKH